VSDCENLVSVDRFLSDVLKGNSRPEDNSQRFALGVVSHLKGHFAASARFYSDAISADPESVVDPSVSSLRYRAACSAVLAGCGSGQDDPRPDDAAKSKLRSQGRNWLRSDLAAWDRIALDSGKKQLVSDSISHWKTDTDLALIRDEKSLSKLPEAERQEWRALWADVNQLITKVNQPLPR
jgi:hypothetical protein